MTNHEAGVHFFQLQEQIAHIMKTRGRCMPGRRKGLRSMLRTLCQKAREARHASGFYPQAKPLQGKIKHVRRNKPTDDQINRRG